MMEYHPFSDGNEIEQPSNRNNPNAVDITAQVAFKGTEVIEPYWSKNTFLEHGKSLRYGEAVDLKTALDCFNESMRMSGHRRRRQDKGGREYVYLHFYQTNGTIETKIVLEPGIERLLDDYHRGKINVKFNFEQLFSEAKREE